MEVPIVTNHVRSFTEASMTNLTLNTTFLFFPFPPVLIQLIADNIIDDIRFSSTSFYSGLKFTIVTKVKSFSMRSTEDVFYKTNNMKYKKHQTNQTERNQMLKCRSIYHERTDYNQ